MKDRGTFRPPRAPQKEPGSPILRVLGGIAIVGGICWGTYLVTVNGNIRSRRCSRTTGQLPSSAWELWLQCWANILRDSRHSEIVTTLHSSYDFSVSLKLIRLSLLEQDPYSQYLIMFDKLMENHNATIDAVVPGSN